MLNYNHTEFSYADILGFTYLGRTTNNWRQRKIDLYQHPTKPNSVISVGITFDMSKCIIVEEPKECWTLAIEYWTMGKELVTD